MTDPENAILHRMLAEKATEIQLLKSQLDTITRVRTNCNHCDLWNVFDHVPIGVAIFELSDYRFNYCNKYLADFNRQSRSSHLGRSLSDVNPPLAQLLEPEFDKLASNNHFINNNLTSNQQPNITSFNDLTAKNDYHQYTHKLTVTLADGSQRHIININLTYPNDQIICFILDITEQVQTAQQLQQTNIELDQKLQDLNASQQQLIQSAKLVSIGQLTAGLAHELNQPLGRILLTAELAQQKIAAQQADLEPPAIGYLTRIIRDVKSATTLISHLKTYSHQDVKSVFQTIDIKQFVDEALLLFNYTMATNKIAFNIDLQHQTPTMYVDPGQIEQVINNILNNAIDGLAESDNKAIEFITTEDDSYIIFSISDNGCGMSAATMSCIFDPFFTTKAAGHGTGLGLSISHGIIESHRGKLLATSVEGKGSCFTIKIPKN